MKKKMLLQASLLCVLLAGYLILDSGKITARTDDYDKKLEAATLTAQCFEAVKELKIEKGIPMDTAIDINGTGMIGQDYSRITTTLGNLESKRTSANPNMAAMVVDMFHELGIMPGDSVAINSSGSFPALNIAVLCAAQVMHVNPVMISSFGASAHGANDPDLTYLDMEYHLHETGLLTGRSAYFSIGGGKDLGADMDPETVGQIVKRLESYGYQLLYDEDLIHNIEARYKLYRSGNDIKCFINVGGNEASFGDSSVMVHAGGGILTKLPENDNSVGLIQLFLKDKIPAIHLLNIKTLAADYGLPVDPSPMPEIGEGGVYYTHRYNKALAGAVLLAAAILLFLIYYKSPGRRP